MILVAAPLLLAQACGACSRTVQTRLVAFAISGGGGGSGVREEDAIVDIATI
jgi:hypothetical protein